jgi:hypothetical protein
MMSLARDLVAPYRGSPYRIGYFSDNEVGWWAGALFVYYSMQPASSATKQRWVTLLRQHYYNDWRRFAADFAAPMGVSSWPGLLAGTAMTRMRAGGNGIAVVREWTGIVAERYYALAERAIRAADPEALYLATGCRSTTTRRRCARWRAMSTRSPSTTMSTAATAGSRAISSMVSRNCRGENPSSSPSGSSPPAKTAPETPTTAI